MNVCPGQRKGEDDSLVQGPTMLEIDVRPRNGSPGTAERMADGVI